MADQSNGNGQRRPLFTWQVAMSPLQFMMAIIALIAALSGVGIKYVTLCQRVDAAFVEMDARTARRDKQYEELTSALRRMEITMNTMRDGMIAAGILKPSPMRPMGHPDNLEAVP